MKRAQTTAQAVQVIRAAAHLLLRQTLLQVKLTNLCSAMKARTAQQSHLKIWAPDATVNLAKEQIEAFKKLYPDKKFDISVVAQGEGDAATALMNDATTAADVFSFPSDQLNLLVDAGVISPCAFADVVSSANQERNSNSRHNHDELYAYPETNDNGYYLVYDKSVVSDEQAGKLEDILAACQEAGKQLLWDCGDGFYSCTFAFTAGVQS